MINIDCADDDAPEFVADASTIIGNIASRFTPAAFIIVKVDNWFDHKWLNFSGKALGAVGTWNEELTVPPFVPNRIVWEREFSLPDGTEIENSSPLHVSVPASEAAGRKVSRVVPDAAVCWISGNTNVTAQGAIMTYIPTSNSHWAWYAGWRKSHSWSTAMLKGISATEFADLSKPAAL